MRLPQCFPDLRVSFQGDVPQVGLLEAFAGHHPQSGCFNGLNISAVHLQQDLVVDEAHHAGARELFEGRP